ncbi:MAG: hypothetical protein ACUVQ4_02670 [bacterium]
MEIKKFSLLLILFFAFLFGHKINIFATVEADKIYTQSYASDGGKIRDGLIEVYDEAGNKLLSGKTDSLGEFSFPIPKRENLKIVLYGGMGHRAETHISVEDLPEMITKSPAKNEEEKMILPEKKTKDKTLPQSPEIVATDTTILKQVIEEELRVHLQPIIRLLAEEKKESITFNEIIGGIGYIIGIVGIAMYFLSRKKGV